MIVSAVLLVYVAVLAGFAAPALRRARWVVHAPRRGLAAWLALGWSLVLSTALAIGSLCVQLPSVGVPFQRLIATCLHALTGAAGPAGIALAAASLFGLGAGGLRLVHVLAHRAWRTHRLRREHTTALRLLGHTDHSTGTILVEDHRAAAYCLPGPHGRIVLTTAARDQLTPIGLRAVIAHERAHLRGRHALLVTIGTLPARLLPGLTTTRDAARAVTRLIEYIADDDAARRTDPVALAEALLTLGTPSRTSTADLHAATTATGDRIARLLSTSRPTTGDPTTGTWTGLPTLATIAALTMPIVLATAGDLTGATATCPFLPAPPC